MEECFPHQILQADFVVIAIGGSAKLKHYGFVEHLGHELIEPIPSLFTFNLPKHPSNQLMGLSVNACVQLKDTKFEECGPLLFTHWGMSGPAILKLSAKAADYLFRKSYQFEFVVTWMENTADYILNQRSERAGTKIWQSKPEELPKRLWEYLLTRSEINKALNWADLNREQLQNIELVLGQDTYRANGKTTFKEEFVTCGGVKLKEINMKKMESKKVEGLYFCGEVINVDAVTGGFNFQAAWTTAFLVADSISNEV